MFRNTKLALAAAGALNLFACATLPPLALTPDHPAHPQAQPAPLASQPSVLSTYRQAATAAPQAQRPNGAQSEHHGAHGGAKPAIDAGESKPAGEPIPDQAPADHSQRGHDGGQQ